MFRKAYVVTIIFSVIYFLFLFAQLLYAHQPLRFSLRPHAIFNGSQNEADDFYIYLRQLKDFKKALDLQEEALVVYEDASLKKDTDLEKKAARFKITEAYKICLGILSYFKENENKIMSIRMAQGILAILNDFSEINYLSVSQRTKVATGVLEKLIKADKLSGFATVYSDKEPKIELPSGAVEKKVSYVWRGETIEAIWKGPELDYEKIKKVFIFPYSVGMGDIVKLDPLFRILETYMPHVKISCMVPSAKKDLIDKGLTDSGYLEVIPYRDSLDARRDIDKLTETVINKSALYKKGSFDVAIIPYDVHRDRSIELCNSLKIPYIITEGYASDYAIKPTNVVTLRRLDKKRFSYRYRHDDIDISHSFAALLLPIIKDVSYLEKGNFIPQLKRGLKNDGTDEDDFLVLIAPSTASAAKWPESNFSLLIDRLYRKYPNLKLVLLRGPGIEDENTVNEILKKTNAPCDIFLSEDVKSFQEIVPKVDLFISNNSGPSHLFDAFDNRGVPQIVIYENRHMMNRWRSKSASIFPILAKREDVKTVGVDEIFTLAENLIDKEKVRVYTEEYSSRHNEDIEAYLYFSPEVLVQSLLDYRTINLSFGQKRSTDIPQKQRKSLVDITRLYLNSLPKSYRALLYGQKFRALNVGRAIKDYLLQYGGLSDRQEMLLNEAGDFFNADGKLLDIKDMSSHRIWEETDEVYLVTLKLGKERIQIVLKTGSSLRNEEFYSRYAEIFNIPSPSARFYNIGNLNFVLMKYLETTSFNSLISHDKDGLPGISKSFTLYSFRKDIVRQLARNAALADMMAKGDRQLGIFEVHKGIYGNYLADVSDGTITIYPIDSGLLFAERDHNRKWTRSGKSEISFIALFQDALVNMRTRSLLYVFEDEYRKYCEEIKSRKDSVITLVREYFDNDKVTLVENNISRSSDIINENIDDLVDFIQRLESCRQYARLSPEDERKNYLKDIIVKIREGSSISPEERTLLLDSMGAKKSSGFKSSRQAALFMSQFKKRKGYVPDSLKDIVLRLYLEEQKNFFTTNMDLVAPKTDKYNKEGVALPYHGITVISGLDQRCDFVRFVHDLIGDSGGLNKWQDKELRRKVIASVRAGTEHVTVCDLLSNARKKQYIEIEEKISNVLRTFNGDKKPMFKPLHISCFIDKPSSKAALVLKIAPVDAEDLAIVVELQEAIKRVPGLGIKSIDMFSGHVTLGYFVDSMTKDELTRFKRYISELNDFIESHSEEFVFELPEIELSQFSDMESFMEKGVFSWVKTDALEKKLQKREDFSL